MSVQWRSRSQLFSSHYLAALLYALMAIQTFAHSLSEKQAQAARARARARIPALAERIASLRRELELLEQEHQQAVELLANYKDPTHMLPPEILAEIFRHVFCNPEEDENRGQDLVGRWSTRVVLQVCRRWRDIGRAASDLWTELDLAGPRWWIPRFMEPGHALPVVEDWLTLSGTRPLTVDFAPHRGQGVSVVENDLFEALLRHATRWHDMYLVLNSIMLADLNRPFPILRKLSLAIVDEPPYRLMRRPEDTRPQIFANAPQLKTLQFTYAPFSTWATYLRFPWAQLTTLIAKAYYVEACTILAQCATLEECELTLKERSLEWWDAPDWEMPHIPPFLHLRKLSLPGCPDLASPESIVQLCEALDLPVLEELKIYEGFIGENPVATLLNLRMDMSVLRRLTLYEDPWSGVDWMPRYTKAFPGVQVAYIY